MFPSELVDMTAAVAEAVCQGERGRMSYVESCAKAFPSDKMDSGMLDPEMIEDPVKIVNEAIIDKIQVNLIRRGGIGWERIRTSEKWAQTLLFPYFPCGTFRRRNEVRDSRP